MLAKTCSFWESHLGWVSSAAFLLLAFCPAASSQAPQGDLAQMNIEDLMKVEVTSVSRHEQSLSQTAAAVFVITEEDVLGLTATSLLRQREQGASKHQVVIALTAHAMKSDEGRCLAAGMDGYLAKPIRPQALDEILTRRLAARKIPHDPPLAAEPAPSKAG